MTDNHAAEYGPRDKNPTDNGAPGKSLAECEPGEKRPAGSAFIGYLPTGADRLVFTLGWIAAALGLVLLLLYHLVPWVREHFGMPYTCAFLQATGFYCPGCGMTRAAKSLLEGHLWRSFLYHPALLYAVACLAVFLISQTLGALSRGKLRVLHFHPLYLYIFAGIIIVQWIVKNLVLLCAGA